MPGVKSPLGFSLRAPAALLSHEKAAALPGDSPDLLPQCANCHFVESEKQQTITAAALRALSDRYKRSLGFLQIALIASAHKQLSVPVSDSSCTEDFCCKHGASTAVCPSLMLGFVSVC